MNWPAGRKVCIGWLILWPNALTESFTRSISAIAFTLVWTKREPPVVTSAGAASGKLRVRTRSYLGEFPIIVASDTIAAAPKES
jgi:hypothetical protein